MQHTIFQAEYPPACNKTTVTIPAARLCGKAPPATQRTVPEKTSGDRRTPPYRENGTELMGKEAHPALFPAVHAVGHP